MTVAARMRKYRAKRRLSRELERSLRAGVDVDAVIADWRTRHGQPVTAIAVTPARDLAPELTPERIQRDMVRYNPDDHE